MDQTARFALPLLAPGQLQKELFHNEALQRADALLSPVVEGAPSATPPASPSVGACYVVGGSATGSWSGQDGSLASFTGGGWRFVAPIEGLRVLDRASGEMLLRRNGAWESGIIRAQELRIGGQAVVKSRQGAIADPSGGSVTDAECRAAVAAILTAMRSHGLIA